MAETSARPRLTWQINRRLLVATLIMLPILIGLGWWQLDRAEEKQRIVTELNQSMASAPLDGRQYVASDVTKLRFRPIRLTGRFDSDRYWLLENKIHRGRVGYAVLAPFSDHSGRHFLVDRGWLAAGTTRENLPPVEVPAGEVEIEGILDRASVHPMLAFNGAGAWPQRVLTLDLARQSEILGLELEPWVVHLSSSSAAVFTPIWTPVVVPVAKHLGYAAQWFTMAAALVLVSLFANSNLARVLFHRSPA